VSFFDFLQFYREPGDTPFDDFAADVARDRDFPRKIETSLWNYFWHVRGYLRVKGACRECLETLEEAWNWFEDLALDSWRI